MIPSTRPVQTSSRTALAAACAAIVATWVVFAVVDATTATRVAAALVAMIFGAYAGFAVTSGAPGEAAAELTVIGGGIALAVVGLARGRFGSPPPSCSTPPGT